MIQTNDMMGRRRRSADYLAKPWSEATLGEHGRMRRELEDRYRTCSNATRRFLRCGQGSWYSRMCRRPSYDLPQIHHAIAACFGAWRQVREVASDSYWVARDRSIEVEPGTFESFLEDGARLYALPDRQRRVIEFERDDEDVCVKLVGPSAHRSAISREFDSLEAYIRENHYLQNQAIRPDGKLLPSDPTLSWDSVAIPDATRELILDNTVRLLARRDIFRTKNVPLTRGVLLHGPPGTGKTLIGRILAGLGQATFIWMTAGDSDKLRAIFALARRLRPTVLFLEDLDFYACDRDDLASQKVALGELLTQLDGLEDNDGLIVIATTNAIDVIEPALKDRPSRFDIVIEISLPDWAARRKILASKLAGKVHSEASLDAMAERTNGLSGAQVKEIAVSSLQKAILRGAVNEQGIANPTELDVENAVMRLTGKSRRPIGFGASLNLSTV